MQIKKILKYLLFVEMFVLLFNVAFVARDYQDPWTLEGVAGSFFLMIATFSIYMVVETDVRWMLFFGLLTRVMWGIVPVFKYFWIPGKAIDQHSHYRLSLDISRFFFVPEGRTYSNTPLSHILTAVYSMIIGVPVYDSFKIIPILFWFSYPLLIYIFVKRFNLNNDIDINKYIIMLSSIPYSSVQSNIYGGRVFGTMVFLFVVYQLLKTSEEHNRRDLFLTLFMFVVMIANHMMSSLYFISFIFTLFVIYGVASNLKRIRGSLPRVLPSRTFLFLIIIVNLSWLFYYGSYLSEKLTELVVGYTVRIFSLVEYGGTVIPTRAFQISIFDLMRVLLVSQAVEIMILGFSFLSVIVILWQYRKYNKFNHLFNIFLLIIYGFIFVGFVFNIGEGWLNRMTSYIMALFPLLAIPLISLFKRKFELLNYVVIAGLLVFSIIGFYSPQDLVPRASAYAPELPSDEYLLDLGNVNSIYQRNLIFYAQDNLPNTSRIACDKFTQHQIIGLTDYNFSYPTLAWFYPFAPLLGGNVTETYYTHFLSHDNPKSGVFIEPAELRTGALISWAIEGSSLVFYNGFSFMITEPFAFSNLGV